MLTDGLCESYSAGCDLDWEVDFGERKGEIDLSRKIIKLEGTWLKYQKPLEGSWKSS